MFPDGATHPFEVAVQDLDEEAWVDASAEGRVADQARKDDLFLNAVRSAGMVRTPMLQERLVRIAKSDANLRARDMAIKLTEGS